MSGTYAAIPSKTPYSVNPSAPPIQATMVDVIAPASLSEGYSFEAFYRGVRFQVSVPPGGVIRGQQFRVPFNPPSNNSSAIAPMVDDEGTPLGRWKDGLCSCFKFGICHPSVLLACFCRDILLAQVLTRMRLDWWGVAASDDERRKTFKKVVYIVVVYWVIYIVIPTPHVFYGDNGVMTMVTPKPILTAIRNTVTLAFFLYSLIVLARARQAVRERYEISAKDTCPTGCEDICCSFWCSCCTVSQLSRQTTDYHRKQAMWCTDTGLPSLSPVMVV